MEHWLPLFHERLDTLLDYLDGTPIALEPLADDVAHERIGQINDYYDARHNVPAAARLTSRPTRMRLTARPLSAIAAGSVRDATKEIMGGGETRNVRCVASIPLSAWSLPRRTRPGLRRRSMAKLIFK